MIFIVTGGNNENCNKAESFLLNIRGILATNDCSFQPSEKNKKFERLYPMRAEKKIEILKSLRGRDCVKIEPNNNPRYKTAEVYVFIKECKLSVYGEEQLVTLYIKMYLDERDQYELVIVISFHQEGVYD